MPSGCLGMIVGDRSKIQYLELKINTFHHWKSKQNLKKKKKVLKASAILNVGRHSRVMPGKQTETFSHLF